MDAWEKVLVEKSLEVTHSQWMYQNVHIPDIVLGMHVVQQKEELLRKTEVHMDMGEKKLEDHHKYLWEINLEELDITSGNTHEYWLLAIRAAREARRLRIHKQNPGGIVGTKIRGA